MVGLQQAGAAVLLMSFILSAYLKSRYLKHLRVRRVGSTRWGVMAKEFGLLRVAWGLANLTGWSSLEMNLSVSREPVQLPHSVINFWAL